MKVQNIPLAEIKPYWRNPRNNEKAIAAVKKSIESYGFNSPLVIDKENVIIAGHSRYKALMELGHKTAPCVVVDLPSAKAKEYRIADNKTSELASWDMELLIPELREIGDLSDMSVFFENIDLDNLLKITSTGKLPTAEQISDKEELMNAQFSKLSEAKQANYVEVGCPECGHEFFVDRSEMARQPGVEL